GMYLRLGDIVETVNSHHKWVLGAFFDGTLFPTSPLTPGVHAWMIRAANTPKADPNDAHDLIYSVERVEYTQLVVPSAMFIRPKRRFTYGGTPALVACDCEPPTACTISFPEIGA